MGCGLSSERHERVKVTQMPGCFMATYQLQPNYAYSQGHALYVEDHKQVEVLPRPSPPPTNKGDIFHIDKYRVLDKRADKAPSKYLREPYSALMGYLLTGVYDDLSKIRVIYRWVTSLKMERILLPKVEPPATTPLFQIWRIKNRKGNYAQLISILCRLANIPCAIIHGRLKGSTYDVGQKVHDRLHYGEWNAVLIDSYWRLLNAYWGACAIGSEGSDDWLEIDDGGEDESEKKADGKFATKEYVYVCDENYFLTDPRQLITTHLPFSKEWQLLSEPITLERFERMAFLKDRFFNLGMSVITHSDCVIGSQSGEVEICFGMPPDAARYYKFYYLLFRQENKDTGGVSPKYDRYVFMHRPKKDELTIRIRSPVTGTFRLELVGRDTRIKDPTYDYDWIALYKIRFFKAKDKCLPFPNMPDLGWGPGQYATQLGLSALSHCSGEVKASWCGEAEISFEVCDYNRMGNPMFYGRLSRSGTKEERLKDRVVHRVENGRVIFNVKLPKRGEYSLSLDGTSGKKPTPRNFANYMVVSDQRPSQAGYPRGFDEGIGKKPACDRFDIVPISHKSGLIYVKQDEFELCFKTPLGTELSLSVIGSDVMVSDSRRLVSETVEGDMMKYKIRLPKEGTYGLKVGLTVRRDLLGAIRDRALDELVNAITLVKERGYEHRMVSELREATKMMERLQHIQDLLHDVQTMSQKTITEIRGYSSPPPAVHRVMMATLLLLGHFEEETQVCLSDWLKLQAIIGKTGRDSIKKRCEELNLDDVPLDIALGARHLLKDYTLDQCRMVSSGAATFYVWAKCIIDEISKRYAEEVAHTRPRTSRSRRGNRQNE
ncbi:hillarin-like [Aplysia californica]|uniref:Hillarin-like n=1 Tax=Aplysia californica TaxID=6500 RepID=A0ABM1W2L2_APLCA|nr:hillarin-like [Aplysia californica]